MTENKFHVLSKELNLPPFLHPDYLDIICGKDNWGSVQYCEGNDYVIWYYWLKKKWTIPYITMHALAKYMGPYFSKKMNFNDKKRGIQHCVKQLPKYQYLYQQLTPCGLKFANILEDSFLVSSGKTHILDLNLSEDDLLRQMSGNNRRSIKKFNNEMNITFNQVHGLYDIITHSLPKPSMLGLDKESFAQLCTLIIEKKLGFTAMLRYKGQLISGVVCLTSGKKTYYLLNGNKRLSGSIYPGIQIMWKVINHLQSLNIESLDLLGSSIPSIAKAWISLGAIPYDYPIIEKSSTLYRRLSKMKDHINLWTHK